MPYEAKTDWKYDDTVTEKDLNRIEQGLKDAHVAEREALTLSPGVQLVEVENDTPFNFGSVRGRTLVNLLGRDGRCDKIGFFGTGGAGNVVVDSTIKRYGDATFKITQAAGETSYVINGAFAGLDRTKKYMFAVDVLLTHSSVGGRVVINLQQSGAGAVIGSGTANAELLETWQTVHAAFDASKLNSPEMSIVVGTMGGGEVTCNADGVRCYEITQAEYDASVSLTPEQVTTLYPYVDGMTNVRNPYVAITGANLCPPFEVWKNTGLAGEIISPYVLKVSNPDGLRLNSAVHIPTIQGATYTYSIEREGSGDIGLDFRDSEGKVIQSSDYVNADVVTAKAPSGAVTMGIWASTPERAGTYIFRNPMLTIGTEPKPFAPQQRSIWAAECDLAANPVDGSNPDVLFVGDDGLPYVLEKWKKNVLDGSLAWMYYQTSELYKSVRIANYVPTGSATNIQYAVKYDGSLLKQIPGPNAADQFILQKDTGYLYVMVSNTDSGWGPDYTPDADEIKAYFLGWKMYDTSGADPTAIGTYNRTDGLHKGWTPLQSYDGNSYEGGYNGSGTPNSIPSTANTTHYSVRRTWQPYRLQYLKAKPTVEPVKNYEIGATLCKGSNMVEVGSGIVLREKANPVFIEGRYRINSTFGGDSRLKHRASEIHNVYRYQSENTSAWSKSYGPDFGHTNGNVFISAFGYDFDPSAVYHVTYTMLDPTLEAPISGSIATNLRGTVSDLVQDVSDVQRWLSVVETQKAEKQGTPQRIRLTPLQGWEGNGDVSHYYKVGNRVTVNVMFQNGTKAINTIITKIPYKPIAAEYCSGVTYQTANDPSPCVFRLGAYGDLAIIIADQGAVKTYLQARFSYTTVD